MSKLSNYSHQRERARGERGRGREAGREKRVGEGWGGAVQAEMHRGCGTACVTIRCCRHRCNLRGYNLQSAVKLKISPGNITKKLERNRS